MAQTYELRLTVETGANGPRGLAPGHYCGAVSPYVAGCHSGPHDTEAAALAGCLGLLKACGHTGLAKPVRATEDDRGGRADRARFNDRD